MHCADIKMASIPVGQQICGTSLVPLQWHAGHQKASVSIRHSVSLSGSHKCLRFIVRTI